MADVYCYSGATGAANGTSWADAYTTLAAALTGAGAGGKVWVAHDHSELTTATGITLAATSDPSQPNIILCVNRAGSTPPVDADITTGAVVATQNTNVNILFNGFAFVHGVTFSAGLSNTVGLLILNSSAAAFYWIFRSCRLETHRTSGAANIFIGSINSNTKLAACHLIDSVVQFRNAGSTIELVRGRLIWEGGSCDTTHVVPTNLIDPGLGSSLARIAGVDLSNISTNLVEATFNDAYAHEIKFTNCKLHGSVVVKNGTIADPGGIEIAVDNCDSSDTNYRMERYSYQGSVKQNTAQYITSGGASDGTTPISWEMNCLAGATFAFPLVSPPIAFWIDSTGSKTFTVEILHDGAADLDDDEVWLEVEILGTSGFPLSTFHNDRAASILATPAAQSAGVGTGSWTKGAAVTGWRSQKVHLTATVNEKGVASARVCLAKAAAYTIYVDPKVAVA